MNTLIRIFWVSLIAVFTLSSCKSTKKVSGTSEAAADLSVKEPSSASQNDPTNSLIWKISGKDLQEPSYLFGTIHVIGSDDFFMPEGTEAGFKTCKHLMLELDMDDPTLMMKMAMAVMMKDQTMKDLLDDEQYSRYKSFMQDTLDLPKMQLMAADRMKPMLAMSMMYPKFVRGEMMSYEGKFVEMAKEQDIEVSGLESIEDQISVIDEISIEDQVTMLMEMVDNFGQQRELFEKMIDLYKAQDIEELVSMMTEYEELADVQADLLDDRNTKWIPLISEQAAKEPTFVAVGAAHLFGEKGVIQLLKDAGYTVEAAN